METGPLVLVSDAPLDRHTADLLRDFNPTDVIVTDAGTTTETLHQWAVAARGGVGRLVVVDSQLRAEASALANLLDAPGVRTAVLLAHNGVDGANPTIGVRDDVVATDGDPQPAAGIFVVAQQDCPAFADAIEQLSAAPASSRGGADAWQLALTALADSVPVQAVPAAPFCASRVAMDLPELSEDSRRLRATAPADDDPLVHTALRPISRRLTSRALADRRPSEALTLSGLAVGLLAALVAAPGGRVSWILAGAALLVANVLLLSDGEVARYHRSTDTRGGRLHRVAGRVIEVAFIFGLAVATMRAGTPAWLLTTATIGLLAVLASAVASRAATGDTVPEFRALRWLAVAVTLILVGPGYALLAFAFGALAVIALVTARALGDPRESGRDVVRAGRFLHPAGSFTDAGVLVRAVSTTAGGGFENLAGRLFGAGLALVGLGTVWSWGAGPWPIFIATVLFVFAAAVALAGPLHGPAAWAVPPLLRGVELSVLVVVASSSTSAGRVAAALAVAGLYLITGEVTDRWRFRRSAPPAWLPLLDLGFDGRILLVTGAAVVGATASATGLWFLTLLLCGLWVASLAAYPWRQPRP